MKKYATLPITRSDYGYNEKSNLPDWLENFADNYEKSAEQKENLSEKIKERYSQLSFQDKINQILNGGQNASPYSSVEEAVEDYQQRTGFAEYRKMLAAQKILENSKKKVAQKSEYEHGYQDPLIPKKFPKNKIVKILAQNEWQLPVNELAKMLGIEDRSEEQIHEEIAQEAGFYFNITQVDGGREWITLNDKGYEVLMGEIDKEVPGRDIFTPNELRGKNLAKILKPGDLIVNNDSVLHGVRNFKEIGFITRLNDSDSTGYIWYAKKMNDKEFGSYSFGDFVDKLEANGAVIVSANKKQAQYSLEKKTLISNKKDEVPEIINKIPAIDRFIRNKVETSFGIQLPAIQQAILENFQRHGVSFSDVKSPTMARYINNILIEQDHNINHTEDPNLGKGVGLQDDNLGDFRDQNRNPFAGLTPSLTYR